MKKYFTPLVWFVVVIGFCFYGWYVVENRCNRSLQEEVKQQGQEIETLKDQLEEAWANQQAFRSSLRAKLPSATHDQIDELYYFHFDWEEYNRLIKIKAVQVKTKVAKVTPETAKAEPEETELPKETVTETPENPFES